MSDENEVVIRMRRQLLNDLFDTMDYEVPDIGTDDYETWNARREELSTIESFDDVRAYLVDGRTSIAAFFARFGRLDHRSVP